MSRKNTLSKNHFDALIVGAGPAGATAAYLLAADGYKVGVIEKHRFPRDKLCGGLLTQKTLYLLETLFDLGPGELKSAGIIQHQSSYYRVGDNSGKCLHGNLRRPFHFVDRKRYDALWVDMAVEAGAEFIFEERVETVDVAEAKMRTKSGRQFAGRFIIAADGVFSRLRSRLSAFQLIKHRSRQQIAAALEVFVPRDKLPGGPDFPGIYYGYIPWGYAWSFPGPTTQILGICSLKARAKQRLAESFKIFLQAQKVPPQEFKNLKGYALPYGNYLKKAGYKNILLIGDAGGFADPLLGEGIYYAHKSAQMAAIAVRQSWPHPLQTQEMYSRLIKSCVVTELKYAKLIRQFLFSLPAPWQYQLLRFLLGHIPHKLEEAVQGQRSFRLLLPANRI